MHAREHLVRVRGRCEEFYFLEQPKALYDNMEILK
jgi:hypothetical protein